MRRLTLLFFILILSTGSPIFSQSSSIYSRFGVGDMVYAYSARRAGMGELGVSVADNGFINSLNPAGWYKINRTRIEFGLNYNGMFLSDDKSSIYLAETDFSGFTMAFPASNLYGITIAAGLVPFSNVSYEVKQTFEGDIPYTITYTGSGGLSKAFLGTSYKLPMDIVMGASVDYYFGNLVYDSRIDFPNLSISFADYENRFNPKGIGATIGFISPDLSSLTDTSFFSDLRFGTSVSYIGKLNLDSILTSKSLTALDTLSFGIGKIEVPLRIILGASVILDKNYLLSLDYAFQAWSDLKVNGNKRSGLQNSQKFSLGFEYQPLMELGSTFWEQIIWRAGLSFEQTQYIIYNEGINQLSVSGGFSLPISLGNTIDLGVQYSIRGTSSSNPIKENILKLNFGISFGELWFIRPEN